MRDFEERDLGDGEGRPRDADRPAGAGGSVLTGDPPDAPRELDPEELQDQLLRLRAEFENYRRRVEREQDEAADRARAGVVLQFLPVLDALEAALQQRPSDRADTFWEGVAQAHKQVLEALEAQGVRRIPGVGERFDPMVHEAVDVAHVEGVGPGRIVAVSMEGYRIGDRLLRPARVTVSK